MNQVRRWSIAVLLILSAATPIQTSTRVAILQIDPEQTGDVVATLESRLVTASNLVVVERQQIDKILREQQLSAMLGPQAVSGRIAIGRILQADLLVFIQPEKSLQAIQNTAQPHFEIAITETHHGLRLVRRAIDAAPVETAATAIQQLIDEAAAKKTRK